jgi:hypothetical protein
MKNQNIAFRSNRRLAKQIWGKLSRMATENLNKLTERHRLSVSDGDLLLIDGKWYVTHAGLLRLATRNRCSAICVQPVRQFCDLAAGRWVFRATVYKAPGSKGFSGFGDADPSNVSPLVSGAEMRVAETRAVNRALRKAYGIGLCSVEELGYSSSPPQRATGERITSPKSNGDISGNSQPRLRDRLCLLIRQHQLDAKAVKSYAADFCGTQELREASRDLVESFISHLAEWAVRDRTGLLCKLNSFAQSQEVH